MIEMEYVLGAAMSIYLNTSISSQELLHLFLQPVKEHVHNESYDETAKAARAGFYRYSIKFYPIDYEHIELEKSWSMLVYAIMNKQDSIENAKTVARLTIDFLRRTPWDIALIYDGDMLMLSRINGVLILYQREYFDTKYWWEDFHLTDELNGLNYSISEES